jgi:hypothetical protein
VAIEELQEAGMRRQQVVNMLSAFCERLEIARSELLLLEEGVWLPVVALVPRCIDGIEALGRIARLTLG